MLVLGVAAGKIAHVEVLNRNDIRQKLVPAIPLNFDEILLRPLYRFPLILDCRSAMKILG